MDLQQRLERYLKRQPKLGEGAFIARGAVVVGAVTLGERASVWFNAVLRGDFNEIRVGYHTNIQDNAVLHVADDSPCVVGNYVTVGHSAVVHACTIGDGALVGMGATVLDGAVIGAEALVGAGSLVPMGMRVPPRMLVVGNPARIVRELSPEECAVIRGYADKYVRAADFHRPLG